jgi:hypothetical protein
MTENEQIKVCKAIASACMWGQGGLAHVIIEKLEENVKCKDKWEDVFKENKKNAEYETTGIVKDEKELEYYLSQKYTLHNYQPGELALFYPWLGGGLAKYIVGDLADKYGEIYDSWNFRVYKERAKEKQ